MRGDGQWGRGLVERLSASSERNEMEITKRRRATEARGLTSRRECERRGRTTETALRREKRTVVLRGAVPPTDGKQERDDY